MIEFSINLAKDLKKVIGLRYIVLSTDNDELKQKYLSVDFKELNQEWMFLKIWLKNKVNRFLSILVQ